MPEGETEAALSRRKRQLEDARNTGNKRRKRRKELRELCRQGKVDAIGVLAGDNEEWESDVRDWKIGQLLVTVPYIGPATTQEIYEVGPFSPRQLVSSLPPDRRARLAELAKEGQRIPGAKKGG